MQSLIIWSKKCLNHQNFHFTFLQRGWMSLLILFLQIYSQTGIHCSLVESCMVLSRQGSVKYIMLETAHCQKHVVVQRQKKRTLQHACTVEIWQNQIFTHTTCLYSESTCQRALRNFKLFLVKNIVHQKRTGSLGPILSWGRREHHKNLSLLHPVRG